MVIIRTSADEVSIQAVSPEFGVQFIWILASQAGGRCRSRGRGGRRGGGQPVAAPGHGRRWRQELRADENGE